MHGEGSGAPCLEIPRLDLTISSWKRAFSQPRERKASQHTPRRPPRPCVASPPPRARPSGGRSAAIPPQHGRTRAGSKLPAGPQRGAAHHRQPQKGAERACDRPTVKIPDLFLSHTGNLANASQPKVAIMLQSLMLDSRTYTFDECLLLGACTGTPFAKAGTP